MTAVAAVVHRNRCWMACDSRVSNSSLAVECGSKLATFGSTVVGYSGLAVLRLVASIDWSGSFEPEIVRRAKELGLELGDFDLLIGRGGRLWYYESGTVYESGVRYAAIGSGASVCLGYLAGTVGVPPLERVRGAIRAAADHCPSVGGRIHHASTVTTDRACAG